LDLYDGVGNWIGQIPVNERIAPSDFTDQGVAWKRLGSVDITHNIFHISTWNSPTDGAIDVNAIRLRAAPMVNDGDVQLAGKGGALCGSYFTAGGSWTTSTQGAYGNSHTSSSTAGSGSSTATWAMAVTPGSYEVDATWVAGGNLTTNATYKVFDGSTSVGSVSVDQADTPSGSTDNGVTWYSLGTFTITGTLLRVTLANSASDGQVSADAIRLLPAYQPA
jgi:hypothetical protein